MPGLKVPISDAHIHVGHFEGGLYFSPAQIVKDMKALGVGRWCFSSTSTGSVPFPRVRREIEEVLGLSEGAALPFLWVMPGMLADSRDLSRYFFCEFRGLKVHGWQGWAPEGKDLRRVFDIAKERRLPVMLHTGGRPCCEAGAYRKICSDFPAVPVILAHGRPIDETAEILRDCPNAYADTAFMPVRDIVRLRDSGLLPQVFWGSDFPVMKYFFMSPPRRDYRRRVQSAVRALGKDDFCKIAWRNARSFFKWEAGKASSVEGCNSR